MIGFWKVEHFMDAVPVCGSVLFDHSTGEGWIFTSVEDAFAATPSSGVAFRMLDRNAPVVQALYEAHVPCRIVELYRGQGWCPEAGYYDYPALAFDYRSGSWATLCAYL